MYLLNSRSLSRHIDNEYRYGTAIALTFILLLVFFSADSRGEVISEVSELLFDELPSVGMVLPGYKAPEKNAPSIAVGDFYTITDDGIDWGHLLGDVMRSSYDGHFDMPSRRVSRWDAWSPGMGQEEQMRSEQSLALYAQRYGTRVIVEGHITVSDGEFVWHVRLQQLPELIALVDQKYSGKMQELPQALQQVDDAVVKELGLPLDFKAPIDASYEQLLSYGQLIEKIQGKPSRQAYEEISVAIKVEENLVPLVLLYIDKYPVPTSHNEVLEQQKDFSRLAKAYRDSASIQLAIVRNMEPTSGEYNILDRKLSAAQRYISRFPDDPMGLILLGDVLASNGQQLAGLAVTLEALRRWPNNFRAWWTLAWGLESYAWRVRGHGYWSEVPEIGKRQFPILKELSLAATKKALTMNPDNAQLWNQKMRAIGDYNDEFRAAFEMAIALKPEYQEVYETAMNYAGPNWGGSVARQQAILDLARKNNLGKSWPDAVARQYMEQGDIDVITLPGLYQQYLQKAKEACSDGCVSMVIIMMLIFALLGALYFVFTPRP